MPADAIRWGIIGAGRVARDFADGLAVVANARVGAVTSRTQATADSFASQFPGVRVHADPNGLVSDPDIDAVYVATPHHRHAADARLCIDNGKPVLCEKPFTMDAAEAKQVVDAARAAHVFCMEAMWMRFIPAVVRARELVEQGAVGDVKLLTADFGVATTYDPSNRFFDPAQGGGALLDRGVYGLSLASMLLGQPDEVQSTAIPSPTGVDETIAVVLRYPAGRLAVVTASLATTSTNEAMVMGTHGKLRLHAPFFCTERLTLTRFRAARPSGGESATAATPSSGGGAKASAVAKVKANPLARQALRAARPLLRRDQRITLRLDGNGYGYEAAEVGRCIRLGLTESAVLPLDETLRVMALLDAVRAELDRRTH
jgi:predicted dehydrogenase